MITINDCIYKILTSLIKNITTYITGRPLTYNISHYIDVIFKVLCTGCQWNSLNDKLHYTVYHKHYIKWMKLGIFSDLYQIVTSMVSKFNKINSDVYIDSSIIRNIGGIEDISYNHKIKSKIEPMKPDYKDVLGVGACNWIKSNYQWFYDQFGYF